MLEESQTTRSNPRYTVRQAAERMGYSESFVRDLIDSREIGYIRRQSKGGSTYRLRESDIEAWEEANLVLPTEPPKLPEKEEYTDELSYHRNKIEQRFRAAHKA